MGEYLGLGYVGRSFYFFLNWLLEMNNGMKKGKYVVVSVVMVMFKLYLFGEESSVSCFLVLQKEIID